MSFCGNVIVPAELASASSLPTTGTTQALTLLGLLSAARPAIEEIESGTMIDAISTLSMQLTSTQASSLLSVASVVANRTVSFTQEMGDALLEAVTRALAGTLGT
jgi:hypothetical protein